MGPKVSVLQLDTRFPRVPGDVGCPQTYNRMPEIIRVPNATVGQVVHDRPDRIDIGPFEAALKRASGDVIVTSCGFLSVWQAHLTAITDRPFISSSLIALDRLAKDHEPGEVLILTFDATRLSPLHLGAQAAFASGIVGLSYDMHLFKVIDQDREVLDIGQAGTELVALVQADLRPQHKHLLLECTNLPPYKRALQQVTGLPITDILIEIERACPGAVHPDYLI